MRKCVPTKEHNKFPQIDIHKTKLISKVSTYVTSNHSKCQCLPFPTFKYIKHCLQNIRIAAIELTLIKHVVVIRCWIVIVIAIIVGIAVAIATVVTIITRVVLLCTRTRWSAHLLTKNTNALTIRNTFKSNRKINKINKNEMSEGVKTMEGMHV
jgi:hypothetical protein